MSRNHLHPNQREFLARHLGETMNTDASGNPTYMLLTQAVLGDLSKKTGVSRKSLGVILGNYKKRFKKYIQNPNAKCRYKKQTQVNAILWDYYLIVLHQHGRQHAREFMADAPAHPVQPQEQPQQPMMHAAVLGQTAFANPQQMSSYIPTAAPAHDIMMLQETCIDTTIDDSLDDWGMDIQLDSPIDETPADASSDTPPASEPSPGPVDWNALLTPNPRLGAIPTLSSGGPQHHLGEHDTLPQLNLGAATPGDPQDDDPPNAFPPSADENWFKIEEPDGHF